jgi:preprotein translocase subunit SecA
VREASERVLGLRPFDVQLIGGMILHEGQIAEMRTGEGKTLVAVLPAYLNALAGRGCHVVTVNDYLARRDCEWVGQVPRFLGLSVGLIQQSQSEADRRAAYACDVTYVTNSEAGFDYLRDNLAATPEELVGRGYAYAVIDEVDSILIDEARTPLIISGQADKPSARYTSAARIADAFERDVHYKVEEKAKAVTLTEEGYSASEELLQVGDLYDPRTQWALYIINALKAKELQKRDVNYIVRGGEAVIVDEFTGRTMPGRRWSEGLHQAVEAKARATLSLAGLLSLTLDCAGGADHPERDGHDCERDVPELLPQLRQAVGNDRHRRHGGYRVRQHLQPVRAGRPPQPAAGAQRRHGRRLPSRLRQVGRGGLRGVAHAQARPPRAGGHDERGAQRAARGAAHGQGHPLQRAEREAGERGARG